MEQLAEESLRSARQAGEAYRTTAVSAWPIRALLERQRPVAAKRALLATLELVPKVQPVSSRAEALVLIWQSVFPGGKEFRDVTWEAISRHCEPDAHWRAARLYACVVWTLATESVSEAEAVVMQMAEGAAKRKAAKLLQRGASYPPRDFFNGAA